MTGKDSDFFFCSGRVQAKKSSVSPNTVILHGLWAPHERTGDWSRLTIQLRGGRFCQTQRRFHAMYRMLHPKRAHNGGVGRCNVGGNAIPHDTCSSG